MKIEQYAFLRKRKKLIKSWNSMGVAAFLFICGAIIWILLQTPIFIEPFNAIKKVEQGILEQSTLEMIAIILPIIVILFFILLIVIVILMYLSFAHEKKYQNIIEELLE